MAALGARWQAPSFWWRERESAASRALLSPLWLLSVAFAGLARLRSLSQTPTRARVPVIAVGNLVVGGAGKSPVARHLASRLMAQGLQVALLSRGYGRQRRDARQVQLSASAAEVGDEPLEALRLCPGLRVFVGSDRAALAEMACAAGAQVLLLDDGLQQRQLAFDLAVVVLDASNPLGNGHLLPRGPLRERTSALRRLSGRGLVWLAEPPQAGASAQLAPVLASLRAVGLGRVVRGRLWARPGSAAAERAFLLAGIARPERFARLAQALGATVVGQHFLPDHHLFSASELRAAETAALRAGASCVLTTGKDAARIAGWQGQLPLRVLEVQTAPEEGAGLLAAVLAETVGRAAPGDDR